MKAELLSNCIRMECENDEDTEVLEGEAVETAIAEIPVELKEAEQQMIKEEEDAERTEEDLEEKQSISAQKTFRKDRLHKKHCMILCHLKLNYKRFSKKTILMKSG